MVRSISGSARAGWIGRRGVVRLCARGFAAKCIAGHASIWSLLRCTKDRVDRLLTIEGDRQDEAVQVRGLANRLANADERNVLERWAKARGIALR